MKDEDIFKLIEEVPERPSIYTKDLSDNKIKEVEKFYKHSTVTSGHFYVNDHGPKGVFRSSPYSSCFGGLLGNYTSSMEGFASHLVVDIMGGFRKRYASPDKGASWQDTSLDAYYQVAPNWQSLPAIKRYYHWWIKSKWGAAVHPVPFKTFLHWGLVVKVDQPKVNIITSLCVLRSIVENGGALIKPWLAALQTGVSYDEAYFLMHCVKHIGSRNNSDKEDMFFTCFFSDNHYCVFNSFKKGYIKKVIDTTSLPVEMKRDPGMFGFFHVLFGNPTENKGDLSLSDIIEKVNYDLYKFKASTSWNAKAKKIHEKELVTWFTALRKEIFLDEKETTNP